MCKISLVSHLNYSYCFFFLFLFLSYCLLPPSFLDTYNLSMSSLGCKALSIVIDILVLWYICWSSSLVHFKNSPKYLTSPWMKFLLYSSFLILLRYSFKFFFHFHVFDGVPIFPSPSVICFFFQLLIISISQFSMPNSISISWLYILIACLRVSNSLISIFYLIFLSFNLISLWNCWISGGLIGIVLLYLRVCAYIYIYI